MTETYKAIEVQYISKFYDNKAVLRNVNFTVNSGTIHGFIGPNGAGKSTTLGISVRLVLPTSGEVYIESKSVTDDPTFNEYLGFVPAESKFPDFTVEKYVQVCGYFRDIPAVEVQQKFISSDLFQFRTKKCHELSTGWKKILQIFTLSLYQPQVMLMDEPFNGLDPNFRHLLMKNLLKVKEEGRTILISSHILPDLQKLADDITMIKNGKIVYSGPKTDDIEKTYEDYFIEKNQDQKTFFL